MQMLKNAKLVMLNSFMFADPGYIG